MRTQSLVFVAFTILTGCAVSSSGVKSVDDYQAEAIAAIISLDVATAQNLLTDNSAVFVDVREPGELAKDGKIPGSIHIPRGVLEFSIDPNHARHNEIFSSGKTVIFYCASGGRSVLATKLAKDMGVSNSVNLEGGFSAWAKAGAIIDLPATRD